MKLSTILLASFQTLVVLLSVGCLAQPTKDMQGAVQSIDYNSTFYVDAMLAVLPLYTNGIALPVPHEDVLPVLSRRNPPTPDDDVEAPMPDMGSCSWPELTTELWNKEYHEKVVHWGKEQAKQYKRWEASRKAKGKHTLPFHWYLTKAWFPRLNGDMAGCNGQNFCSTVSCEYITKDQPEEQRKLAFYAFQTFSTWYENQSFLKKDIDEAFINMNARIHGLVSAFTDADTLVASLADQKLVEAKKLHLVGAIFLSVQPLIGVTKGGKVLTAVTGALVGAYSGFASRKLDNARFGADPHWKLTVMTEEMVLDMNSVIGDLIKNQTHNVITGTPDSDDQPFIRVLDTKNWAGRNVRDPNRTKQLETQMLRLIINHLWNSAFNYIVRADSGDCAIDSRVPRQVTGCIPGEPNKVHEVLFIGLEKQGKKHGDAILLRGPPGFDLLGTGDYANITLQDVVQDSVRYKALNGYDVRGEDMDYFRDTLEKVTKGEDPKSHWPTFTLPILDNPGGEALSSINMKESRNYPMMSVCSWDSITDECNQEHQRFLQRTGLFASTDYRKMARRNRGHHVRFHKHYPISFVTPNPKAVLIKCAVKKIKRWSDHNQVGYQAPGDDGLKDHGN